MKFHWRRTGLLFALGVLALALLAACGSETSPEPAATTEPEAPAAAEPALSTVAATLSEWAVMVDVATVPAGEVTFNVENAGAIPHELVVVRSDLAEDALPVADGRVVESEIDIAGEIEEFATGTTESGTFALDAGSYVLICNIPAHYAQGMHTTFTVE
ncbi:MAG: sulfocyanin-like copper-binding protein [Chloroflexi bacterium]|nr:sulfocyanin-like copper-binding protein [Chloroflexota bacterium]